MPIIQQQRGVKSVKGLPLRWGVKAYRELKASRGNPFEAVPERYKQLCDMLDAVADSPLPLDTTDAQIIIFAQNIAAQCKANQHSLVNIRRTLAKVGIDEPNYGADEPAGFIARASDPAWVCRQVRKSWGQKFEHAAIRLGFVSVRAGAYASNETVQRRIAQNARNKKILESVTMENFNGQTYTLAELAAKGTANKAIRRGELMLRMRGMEEISQELGHVGVFVTLTCPSKYHGVLWGSGTTNPKYNNATPKQAQAYLQGVWQCIRAKMGREGVQPYGFRIAEPHHDACPHWHMLLFIAPENADRFIQIMHDYALAEDGDEPGAKKNRVKILRIEAGKGSAAAYIAKYVGKNIDSEHVESHTDEDGSVIESDLIGDEVIKPCQRVEAWAAQWNIRQFQSIGAPPVTVWRELRRIEEKTMRNAPGYIQDAWKAAQKVEDKNADYAAYIRAQGGINTGRKYRIAIANAVQVVEGRYGVTEQEKPVGIYGRAQPNGVYESVRFQWSRVGSGAAFDLPRTCVNNCTGEITPAWVADSSAPQEIENFDHAAWFGSEEAAQLVFYPGEIDALREEAEQEAALIRANTVWTMPKRGFSRSKYAI